MLLIVLVFVTFPFHTPIFLFQDPSPLPFLVCRLAMLLVHIVGQAIVIWNMQQFDTHPVLCVLGEGNFVIFCAAQEARPVHLPVSLFTIFFEG